jgi:hypothetical protein
VAQAIGLRMGRRNRLPHLITNETERLILGRNFFQAVDHNQLDRSLFLLELQSKLLL